MSDIVKRKYTLAEPGSGLMVLSMDGGEINLFGGHTVIEASEFDFYDPVKDFLIEKLVEEKADTMYNIGVAVTTALAVVAGAAIVCAATVATGGAALVLFGAGFMAGGAAIMTGNYTFNTLASDRENGYDRSWQEFFQDLNKNIMKGAVTGAVVYVGILLFVDVAAMSASLLESFLSAGPALAGVTATGETVATAAAIPELDVLVSAGSIAALYEATQLGKGGGQGDKEGVHFEESNKAPKGDSEEVNVPKNVERQAKKLSPEAKKGYDKAINALKNGDTRGLNDHPLSGNRSGQRAIDIKGTGKGRGAGRIIYEYGENGEINIIEILTDHKY